MRYLKAGFALLLVASSLVEAQEPPRGRGRRGGPPRDSTGAPVDMRAARQAIERLIRNQVRPTDAQLRQLQAIDARFEPQRAQLNREEMSVRRELRQSMQDTANLDEAKIGQLLDRMIAFPARRAALIEQEQQALAGVLTPLQRAKYHAIQEQLRRRIEQAGRGGPPGRPPEGRSKP
ncbi:MAG TPA: Spy/CpxP family protein refolding chaperone [Gemmatimonadaceae bacterium]|nr:Spy/CpxP family protein refolding chaperone [Gemmatimonadaceae bacterium]